MPIDDRSDLDRMSRHQLYMEADAWGIEYPRDLAKYVWNAQGQVMGGMVSLLESRGVNRGNMKTVRWSTIYPSEQERAAAAHQGVATSEQHYPDRPLNQSRRDGVDSAALLQDRLAAAEAKNELHQDESTRLKAEKAELEERIAALEARLDTGPRPPRRRRRKGPDDVENAG